MTFHITLRSECAPHVMETRKRWHVHLNGELWGEPFYYNMHGYRGLLPLPGGRVLDPGEITLTTLRREIARINREAAHAEVDAQSETDGSASLIGYWYALGPEDKPFSADDPDWAIHRIVADEAGKSDVLVVNPAGQRFLLDRATARSIALPPSDNERTHP